jgi:sarcosine oxidase subunit beta
LKRAGLRRVVLLERRSLGAGASSRAAGMVRAQGGTEWAVRLGMWTRDFYEWQRDELGTDSGFVEQGYLMPAFDERAVAVGRARVEMQRSLGLDVSWLAPSEAEELLPALARGAILGGSYAAGDGYIDPPRNVSAYTAALLREGVEVREHTEATGLVLDAGGSSVAGVKTPAGLISTRRVVLTGGPELAAVGELAGARVFAGGTRHQVAVTEASDEVKPERIRMLFDIAEGLYWRPEDGGVLFGMSNPVEPPGPAREVDWPYLDKIRQRLAELLPASANLGLRKVWAATIDYTPDHLPIIGPAPGGPEGVTIASAGGHGMMWGPAVARVVADVALDGSSEVLDVSELGLDRFDAAGNSRLEPDPIALPFPERTSQP